MRRRLALSLAALLAVTALSGCTTRVVTTPSAEEDRVTVTGEGTALSAPDRATLRFGVQAQDPDPRKAMSEASRTSNKLVEALKRAGIADKDLQTGNVSLDAQYDNRPGPPRITGYMAAIDVSARTTDLGKIGDVIVAATSAGAARVSGISFELSETNPTKYAAAAEAVRDARKRAEAIAKAAGKSVGDVISIGSPQTVQPFGYPQGLRMDSAAGLPAYTSPQIQPGQLTERTLVTATFQLK